jgi:hypothetical protein
MGMKNENQFARMNFGRFDERVEKKMLITGPAELAFEMLCRWGPVLATPDGEDSSGRQKGRVLDPKETVWKACEIARVAWHEFIANGWMLEIERPAKKDGDE